MLGKVSEILIPLDMLLCQKFEIVRKLAGKGVRNSDTSGQSRCYVKNLNLREN